MQLQPRHTPVLSCRENFNLASRAHQEALNTDGICVACGLGGSFLCLEKFVSLDVEQIFLIEKDPTRALLGQVILAALAHSSSAEEFLSALAHRATFDKLYSHALAEELGYPAQQSSPSSDILSMRRTIFNSRDGGLKKEELLWFDGSLVKDKAEIEIWASEFFENRAFFALKIFKEAHEKLKLLSKKILIITGDILESATWEFLRRKNLGWNKEVFIYLSDYPSWSLINSPQTISTAALREVMSDLKQSASKFTIAFSHTRGLGQLLVDDTLPDDETLAAEHFGTDPTAIVNHQRFEYLDGAEAAEMAQVMFEFIKKRGYRRILDVGCRMGLVTQFLDSSYQYLGFDICPEVIEQASMQVSQSKATEHFKFIVGDWNNPPDVEADIIIFGGVFFYVGAFPQSKKPFDIAIRNKFLDKYLDKYSPKQVIIQDLNATYLDGFFDRFPHEKRLLKLKIKFGKRQLIDLDVSNY